MEAVTDGWRPEELRFGEGFRDWAADGRRCTRITKKNADMCVHSEYQARGKHDVIRNLKSKSSLAGPANLPRSYLLESDAMREAAAPTHSVRLVCGMGQTDPGLARGVQQRTSTQQPRRTDAK